METRRSEVAKIKEQEDRRYKTLRQSWDKTWQNIKSMPMLRQHRQQVQARFADKKKTELATFRNQMKLKKGEIRTRYPFTAWNTFLHHKAGQGNETALAILSSRQVTVQTKPMNKLMRKPREEYQVNQDQGRDSREFGR